MITNIPSDKDREEAPDYYPDYEEVVARLRAVEQQIDDKRGGGFSTEIRGLMDNVSDLETELENFQYNVKKNFEELNDTLIHQNILSPYRTPNYRWNRRVRT